MKNHSQAQYTGPEFVALLKPYKMTHRRKFLVQSALAAGSLVFARPLQTFAFTSTPQLFRGKISIADISGMNDLWNSNHQQYDNQSQLTGLQQQLNDAGCSGLL